jgi:membrane associated rhomboid family serine protease
VIPIPVGDENPTSRPPAVNLTLIALNGLAFVWFNVVRGQGFFQMNEEDLRAWALLPGDPTPIRFLASMFLHATPMHLLGNMWFLHLFGDNVEDKLGRGKYLLLYLGWGGLASLAFLLLGRPVGEIAGMPAGTAEAAWNRLPMVGASGAISGVMGAYLVFFPRARIRMIWWILVVLPFTLPAIVVILMYFFQDLMLAALSLGRPVTGGTAYAAHTGGMVAGIVAGLLFKPFLRRGGGSAWDRDTGFSNRPIPATGPGAADPDERPPLLPGADLRTQIVGAVYDGRMDLALELHGRWLESPAREPLPARVEVEIAHEALRRGRVEEAAEGYARFLEAHPDAPDALEARFRLGLIHARATGDVAAARALLRRVSIEHPDPATRDRARRELDGL